MNTVIEHEGYRITVSTESDPLNPREWDNLGHMVCLHNKYRLGDVHDFNRDDWDGWDDIRQAIVKAGGVVILPLGIYDHGGISMYVGTRIDPWDSGQVGFIYVTQEDLDREGIKDLDHAEALLRGEVKSYDKYLRGDIYSYTIEENRQTCSCGECHEWQVIDSCGGWEEEADAIMEAKQVADHYAKKAS